MSTYPLDKLQFDGLSNEAAENHAEINGKWVPARPINYQCRSLWERLKEAWAVFWGKLDTVEWPEGQ